MHVIVTSGTQVRALYGARGLAEIEQALDELEAAREVVGIRSIRYYVELGIPELHVAGAVLDWQAIVTQIEQIDGVLRAGAGDGIESVLIIGGPRVVPFGVLDNPVHDRDLSLPADCVYGAVERAQIAGSEPELDTMGRYGLGWPVGRLPDADEPTPHLLIKLIRAAASQHRQPPGLPLTPVLGYSTAIWQFASQRVFDEASHGTPRDEAVLLLAPPTTADTFDRSQLGRARLIFCNLHGVHDGPIWYGQAEDDPLLLPALRPHDLRGLDLSGAVMITEACYGAALAQHTVDSSLALMVLSQGAVAFIGAGVITYGPIQPPSSEADLLALHFVQQLRRTAKTVGSAFLEARLDFLREALQVRGYLDDDDEKTILGFVLYGDPTLRV